MSISRHASDTEAEAGLEAGLALGVDALRIGRLLRDPAQWPACWREPQFGREVERSRRELARIRSAKALAAMYAGEPFHLARSRPDVAVGDPTRLAYAL